MRLGSVLAALLLAAVVSACTKKDVDGAVAAQQPVREPIAYVIPKATIVPVHYVNKHSTAVHQDPVEVELPKLPARAYDLIPVVNQAIDDIWPDMAMRSYFPSQIEAESCITLTHSKCWNPRAELKTSREYGFGLGQITIAYHADGRERFNVFEEVKRMHPDLRGWDWADRYNPLLQIKAIVVKNKVNWGAITWPVADFDNKMAFLATFYNGGNPNRDRVLCSNTRGCDPTRWWGNVELHSVKSKTKLREYGNRSLFEISREYPRKVLIDRRPKYIPYMGS